MCFKSTHWTLTGMVLVLLLCGVNAQAATATIAVAANFAQPIRALATIFTQQTGHQLRFAVGSTGKLYAQIQQGAPFDAFFAADTKRPKLAVSSGLAVAGSEFVYAQGQLALFVWPGEQKKHVNTTQQSMQPRAVLHQSHFRYLALANPKTAPYGAAAQAYLQQQGLWSALQSRLVYGESIGQTFQFVATKHAQAGLLAYSQLLADNSPLSHQGQYWRLPVVNDDTLHQSAVLLKAGALNEAAVAFLAFMKTKQAQDLIRQWGYLIPQTPEVSS